MFSKHSVNLRGENIRGGVEWNGFRVLLTVAGRAGWRGGWDMFFITLQCVSHAGTFIFFVFARIVFREPNTHFVNPFDKKTTQTFRKI